MRWTREFGIGLGLACAALIQRGVLAALALYTSDDAGTVGLMALDILRGERPLFLYGFPYSGALHAYLVAGSFALFGVHPAAFVLPSMLFSAGWGVVTYLLFRDLYGIRVGVAASLLVICADWTTSWYSLIPDCSYSPLFFLGTLALWLTVRIVRLPGPATGGGGLIPCLGAVAGVGVWVHPLMAVYLAAALPAHVLFLVRQRFRAIWLLRYMAGGVLMSLALLPYAVGVGEEVHGPGGLWVVTAAEILHRLRLFAGEELPMMAVWPRHWDARPVQVFVAVLLGAGSLQWAVLALRSGSLRRAGRFLLPLMFCGLFLVFYLPHHQAGQGTLRYLIPFWIMAVTGLFAVPLAASHRRWRLLAWLLLAGWIGYNAYGVVDHAIVMNPARDRHQRVHRELIDMARDAGLDTVILVADFHVASMACALRYEGRDAIRFVAAHTERDARAWRLAEADPSPGFACEPAEKERLAATLDMLGVSWRMAEGEGFVLFHDLVSPDRAMRAVPLSDLTVEVEGAGADAGAALVDGNPFTGHAGRAFFGRGVRVDLGAVRDVGGFVVLGWLPEEAGEPDLDLPRTVGETGGLPASFVLEGSADGRTYHALHQAENIHPVAYRDGPRPFLDSGIPRQEVRFAPATVRYLRYVPRWSPSTGAAWKAAEIHVLEDSGPATIDWAAEADRIRRQLFVLTLDRVVADRWLGATLAGAGLPVTAPPHRHLHIYDPLFRDRIPAVEAGPNTVFAVPSAFAGEVSAPGDPAIPHAYRLISGSKFEEIANFPAWLGHPFTMKP